MANAGKFCDRSPNIRPAGLPSCMEIYNELLKEYSPDELLKYFRLWKCKWNMQHRPRETLLKEPHYDTIAECMVFDHDQSQFVLFLVKFYEEMYSKRAPLGEARKIGAKPDEITNDNTTFGVKSDVSDESLYDIILPPKSAGDILREMVDHHDWHIISHNAYFPSERICRHYNDSFDPNYRFGKKGKAFWDGSRTKRAMEECPHRTFITRTQYEFYKRTHSEVGKNHFRFKYTVPLDKAYGIVTGRDECDAGALLEERNPCPKAKTAIDAVAYITKMREHLHMSRAFDINVLYHKLKTLDVEKSGSLPINSVFEALNAQVKMVNRTKLINAMKHYKIIDGEVPEEEQKVNWKSFWGLINFNVHLPPTDSLGVVPQSLYKNITAYMELCNDREKPLKPFPIPKECFKEDIPTVAVCVSPDIPAQFFLEPKDFRQARSKETLQRIFSRLIKENFDEIWETAKSKFNPPNDLLSVNQIREVYSEDRDKKRMAQKAP